MDEKTQKQLNMELYDKLHSEKTSLQKWLEEVPGRYSLQCARTYWLMKDILFSLARHDLSAPQAQALLAAQTPLKDIVKFVEHDSNEFIEKLFSCIASCADSHLASAKSVKLLQFRVEHNYRSYQENWLQMHPEGLIDHCEELAIVTHMAKIISEVVCEADAEYLLRFKNPLAVVSDAWIRHYGMDSLVSEDDMAHLLRSLRERDGTEDVYELDAEFITPSEES